MKRSISAAILVLALGTAASAAPPSELATPGFGKLSTVLQGVAIHQSRGGPVAARTEAAARGLRKIEADQRVTVLLEPGVGRTGYDIDRAQLVALGARVEATSRSWMRVSLPLGRLAELGAHRDVARVIEPATPNASAEGFGTRISEAVAVTGADEWHIDGWIGSGVRVAVIDLGFDGLTEAKAAGELPAATVGVDFTGSGLESGGVHGTGVAEHVLDMAPGVELYVLKVGDQVDLQNAADYLRTHGIHIANHSVGWVNTSYYDDTGSLSMIVNDSREDDGVFWVVAAGNSARRHWRGGWLDSDADGWLEFATGDEGMGLTTASSSACLYLNWNQYGNSVTNLDFEVRKANGTVAASSSSLQGGTRRPAESICMTYRTADAPYTVAVKLSSGPTTGLDMTLFSFNNDLEHKVIASSLMDPAPARGAFTVAAVNQSRWNDATPVTEAFSSRGPSNDGRMKPDITAPDGTTSFTYGTRASYGTSFSAPTTAGAAALYLGRDPSLTPDELEDVMKLDARDVGTSGADSTYGSGLLDLALPTGPGPEPTTNVAPVAKADVASTSEDTAVTTAVLANDSDADGDVLVLGTLGTVANGALSKSGTTSVKFTPKTNWSGITSYSYTVSDGHGGVATGLVTVTVTPVNDVPVAGSDSATTTTGVATTIVVLTNDVDLDGDTLSVSIATQSAYGVALVNSDRTIKFTPNGTFAGTTSFQYNLSDSKGGTSRGTVTVVVTPAPTVPTVPGPGGVLASDNFDTGTGLGGAGWLGGWTFSGYAVLTDLLGASTAPWHVRLRSSNGLGQRTLAGGVATSLRVAFRAKVSEFESGDTAVVKVSTDGGTTWKVIKTFTSAQSDGVYRSYDIDLAPFGAGSASGLRLAFDANMNASADYLYIDDVQVFGAR